MSELTEQIRKRDVLPEEMPSATLANVHNWIHGWGIQAAKDRRALLEEIERLTAEAEEADSANAQLRGACDDHQKMIDILTAERDLYKGQAEINQRTIQEMAEARMKPNACQHPWSAIVFSSDGNPACVRCLVNLVITEEQRNTQPSPPEEGRDANGSPVGGEYIMKPSEAATFEKVRRKHIVEVGLSNDCAECARYKSSHQVLLIENEALKKKLSAALEEKQDLLYQISDLNQTRS